MAERLLVSRAGLCSVKHMRKKFQSQDEVEEFGHP
jgi:hypothetical protein